MGGLIHHLLFIELHFFIRYVLQQISKTISFRFQFHGKHSPPAHSNPRHALETGLNQQCPARYQKTTTALRGST